MMAKSPTIVQIAVSLAVAERVLLFCVASGTDWQKAGVTGETATLMIVKGLLDRDAAGRLRVTSDGRNVLRTLIL